MREIWLLLDSRGIGGIESHVAELAVGLLEAGDRPRVLFLADHGPHPLRQRLDREGVPWEALSGGLSGLLARCRTGRPRVLHTHGYKANILGRIAGTLTRTPLVATWRTSSTRWRTTCKASANRWHDRRARQAKRPPRPTIRCHFFPALIEVCDAGRLDIAFSFWTYGFGGRTAFPIFSAFSAIYRNDYGKPLIYSRPPLESSM